MVLPKISRGSKVVSVRGRGVLPAAERPPSYPLWPAAHLDEVPRLVGSETDLIGERVGAPRTALPLSRVFEYLHEASSAAGLEHEAAPMPGEIEYVPSVRFEPDARVVGQTVFPGRVLSFRMVWVPRFGRDKLAENREGQVIELFVERLDLVLQSRTQCSAVIAGLKF